jgi:phosphoribosylformimino-5-aminoimidazole carboxamide ribotide isomerase
MIRIEHVPRGVLLGLREAGLGTAYLKRDMHPTTRHWGMYDGPELVACATVVMQRGMGLRGMVVSPTRQRSGLGRTLLQHIEAEVSADMWCNARQSAVPFYASCGWMPRGPLFLLGGAPHQRMERQLSAVSAAPPPDQAASGTTQA